MSSPTGNEILISQRDRVTKKLGLLTKNNKKQKINDQRKGNDSEEDYNRMRLFHELKHFLQKEKTSEEKDYTGVFYLQT